MKKNKRDTAILSKSYQKSVEIPDEMWEWLREAAEERQTSRAGMIRILIASAMKREKKAKEDDSTSY